MNKVLNQQEELQQEAQNTQTSKKQWVEPVMEKIVIAGGPFALGADDELSKS